MSDPISICEGIRLKQSDPALPKGHQESVVTLAGKMDDFIAEKISRDEIYGFVIPLLIQGKVRLDFDNHSERLEMEDPSLRQTRTDAVRIFDHFLQSRDYGTVTDAPADETPSAETQRIVIHRNS